MNIPQIGLGTFRLQGEALKNSLESALELGYRHIDTAQIYENEKDIGDVLSKSGIERSSLFITSKVWIDFLVKTSLPTVSTRVLKTCKRTILTSY